MDDLVAFACLITALRPWLGDLVLVGGWAHRMHRFHTLAQPPAHLPLRTRDADLAFSTAAVLRGDIGAALGAAGFHQELLGEDTPPVTHYRLGEEDAGFYAEFLTPLSGSGVTRRGASDSTVRKAGITAQKLRYLDVLLVSPWNVTVGPERGVPTAASINVPLPNPVSFIVQRLLIHADRTPLKRSQDVLYIHDTLELFGASMDRLREIWKEEVGPSMPARTAKRGAVVAADLFAAVTDTIRDAARMPQDRRLSPEHLRLACQQGLTEMLQR